MNDIHDERTFTPTTIGTPPEGWVDVFGNNSVYVAEYHYRYRVLPAAVALVAGVNPENLDMLLMITWARFDTKSEWVKIPWLSLRGDAAAKALAHHATMQEDT